MQIKSWRTIIIAGAACLFVLYGAWWGKMISNATERSGTDFIAFYTAGRVAKADGFSAIYDIQKQHEVEQAVVGFRLADEQVLLYNHMPFVVPLLTVIVNDNYVASFSRWALILVLVYIFSSYFIVNTLFDHETAMQRFVLFLSIISFLPIFISVWQGQDTAFLYLGAVLWGVGLIRKNEWLIALGLTLMTVRPHISIALALPLLFKQIRAWWKGVALISGVALASVLMIRMQGTVELLNLLRISAEGVWYGMKPAAMFNLLGMLLRIIPFPSPAFETLVGWSIYFVGLGLIMLLWRRSSTTSGSLLALTLLIALLTVPHLHFHDLALLVLTLLFIVHEHLATDSDPRWLALPLVTSFFLVAGILMPPLYFILPYCLYALIIWLLFRHSSLSFIPSPRKEKALRKS